MPRYLVRVNIEDGRSVPLRYRTGAGLGYTIVGLVYDGYEAIINQVISPVDGWMWYKWETGVAKGYWSCAQEIGFNFPYLKIIKDLTPKPAPKPKPKPKPDNFNPNTLDGLLDAHGKLPPYDVKYDKQLKYDPEELEEHKDLFEFKDIVPNSMYTDYSFIQDNIRMMKSNNNMTYLRGKYELNQKYFSFFNRHKVIFADELLSKSFAHVFFTRPDLNIIGDNGYSMHSQIENDPTFKMFYLQNPLLLRALSMKYSGFHDFHPYLSNKPTSFSVDDEVIKTEETGENNVGYKVVIGKNNHESLTAGSFNVNFIDDRELMVYKTNKIWVDYISKVFKGELVPKREYKINNILDYACSTYFFVCAEDGENILFAHKYTGVFPTNAPSSITSWTKGSYMQQPEETIQYAYSFRESMNLLMLAEFNLQSNWDDNVRYNPIYNQEIGQTANTWSGAPFVEVYHSSNGVQFKLRFRPSYQIIW